MHLPVRVTRAVLIACSLWTVACSASRNCSSAGAEDGAACGTAGSDGGADGASTDGNTDGDGNDGSAASDGTDGDGSAADGGDDGSGDGADGTTGDGTGGDGADGSAGAVWTPSTGTTWQWQLTGTIDSSLDVAMYDVDLFETPKRTIEALHEAGRIVICYFSAGSREDWRDDASDFKASDYGNELDGWPGETWLDTRSTNVRTIMEARLDLAVQKGCDGVEPDNVDGYTNEPGFALTKTTQLDYNRFLASAAHERGLSVGLKNALDLVEALEPHFDWALNEECMSYDECGLLAPFVDANKAVFHVEYVDDLADAPSKRDDVCGDASIEGFSTLVKGWDLGAEFFPCP